MKRVTFLLVLVASCWSQDVIYDELPPGENDEYYSEPGRVNEHCTCVADHLCEKGDIVDDGSNIIVPKRLEIEELPLDQIKAPVECAPYHVCCRLPPAPVDRPYEHLCGVSNPKGRIMTNQGTGDTEFGEWPWQAAILKRDGDDFTFKCGGTLIDEKHIITVAHCVDKVTDDDIGRMVVRLGEWDSQTTTELLPYEDFDVKEIVIHPKYRWKNLYNDIAVIVLAREVSFKPHIRSVCLPRDDDDFTGHECTGTGWGTSAHSSDVFSGVLRKVSLPVVSNDDCQLQLRRTRLGAYFRLYSGFLCAGGRVGEDTCKGDGGGPLVCNTHEGFYTVVGLVAWGVACGTEGVPGVYVNVMKYNDWIASVTGKPVEHYWRRTMHGK